MGKANIKLIANNKKAYHDYFIEDTYEAGIALAGTEVKSLRMGKCSIKESFIRIEKGEVFIYGMHISPYEKGNIFNKDPLRVKKLLLHKYEINKMAGKIASFLLKNTPALPQPYTYDSLRSVLANLAGMDCQHPLWTLEQCAVVIKSAYLCENGLLPEGQTEQQNDFLENLVAAGIDNSPLPDCAAEYWSALNNWLNSLIEFHHLKR